MDEQIVNNELASIKQRFGNFILDLFFLIFFLKVFLTLVGLENSIEQLNENILGLSAMFIYYTIQEALCGKTLGKRITGTKAVNEDGSKLTPVKALVRTLYRFIPFEPISFLFGGQGKPRGWHDLCSKTIVISTKKIKKNNSSNVQSFQKRSSIDLKNQSGSLIDTPI